VCLRSLLYNKEDAMVRAVGGELSALTWLLRMAVNERLILVNLEGT